MDVEYVCDFMTNHISSLFIIISIEIISEQFYTIFCQTLFKGIEMVYHYN